MSVADLVTERAEQAASRFQCEGTTDWRKTVENPRVEAVVVATHHADLPIVAGYALECGRHVLVEKPAGVVLANFQRLHELSSRSGLTCKVGFNNRFHRHIQLARKFVADGGLGEPHFARVVLGNGGRPGLGQEWRGSKADAGGGALVDVGIHAIDLLRWHLGELQPIAGTVRHNLWRSVAHSADQVEDNAYALLGGPGDMVAMLHASWTNWSNLFRLEISGSTSYITVTGLGGAKYGRPELLIGERLGNQPPEIRRLTGDADQDISWRDEWAAFKQAVSGEQTINADLADAEAAMTIVEGVYRSQGEADCENTL